MPSFSREQLVGLLVDPREDLNFEIKNWLDLRSDNDAKATFAKAALAIANHGGGFIAIGLAEVDGIFVEAPGRPANLDAYAQDLINGIIHNYCDSPFHCSVHVTPDSSERFFPIIVVPGGHRNPVRARRAGPHGNIGELNAIYIRKPGPRSEVPQSSQEWDGLLSRCLASRRDELLDQMRDLLSGSVPQIASAAERPRLDQWIEASLARWNALAEQLPAGSGPRCPHGFYWFAYEIGGQIRRFEAARFSEVLRTSVVRHTGWPPFWYPTRQGIEPYLFDGAIECWLGGDTRDPIEHRDPAHSDFWRISPDGLAFLLRGYQEDGHELNRPVRAPIEPGTVFDVTLPVWRCGEALLHAARLAENLADGPATISFTAHYSGLAGRTLASVSGNRHLHDGRLSRQDSITLRTTVEATSVGPNLPEIVRPLLAPLYSLFAFFELPTQLVTDELARMRSHNF